MAGSRLEKIGTIFSRVSGLLKTGAMKKNDKPVWYDVYRAFPPKLEPVYGRSVDFVPIKNILYPEDTIRAMIHARVKKLPADDLQKEDVPDLTKKILRAAQKSLEEDSSLTESDAVDKAIKQLVKKSKKLKSASTTSNVESVELDNSSEEVDLSARSAEQLSLTSKILDRHNKKVNLENITTSGESVKDVVEQNIDVESNIKK